MEVRFQIMPAERMKPKIIPYSRQSVSKADIENVKKTLISDFLTTGPQIYKFEKKI